MAVWSRSCEAGSCASEGTLPAACYNAAGLGRILHRCQNGASFTQAVVLLRSQVLGSCAAAWLSLICIDAVAEGAPGLPVGPPGLRALPRLTCWVGALQARTAAIAGGRAGAGGRGGARCAGGPRRARRAPLRAPGRGGGGRGGQRAAALRARTKRCGFAGLGLPAGGSLRAESAQAFAPAATVRLVSGLRPARLAGAEPSGTMHAPCAHGLSALEAGLWQRCGRQPCMCGGVGVRISSVVCLLSSG